MKRALKSWFRRCTIYNDDGDHCCLTMTSNDSIVLFRTGVLINLDLNMNISRGKTHNFIQFSTENNTFDGLKAYVITWRLGYVHVDMYEINLTNQSSRSHESHLTGCSFPLYDWLQLYIIQSLCCLIRVNLSHCWFLEPSVRLPSVHEKAACSSFRARC